MTETTDRAALIAEAAEYEGYCYFCGDLMPNLAAALADADRELAVTKLELAVAKSVSGNAVRTLAQIASLDISATRSIEDLVAPWRRLPPNA